MSSKSRNVTELGNCYLKPLPTAIYQGTACANCFKLTKDLMRCGGCLHSWYCSRECQKAHHKEHKPSCKILAVWNSLQQGIEDERPDAMPDNPKVFTSQRVLTCQLLEQMYGELPAQVGAAICGEARCSICMKTRDQLPGGLQCCPVCYLGWSCEAHTQEYMDKYHDQFVCDTNKLMNEMQTWWHRINKQTDVNPNRYLPETLKTTFTPVPMDGWNAYAGWRPLPEFDVLKRVSITQCLTQPLTVMLGLQHHYTHQELAQMQHIRLHVLGAHMEEVFCLFAWEELLHLLPACTSLHVDLIGPELNMVQWGPTHKQGKVMEAAKCAACSNLGRTFTVAYHPIAYHDFIKQQKEKQGSTSTVPTLAVAFNSGMHQDRFSGSWGPSLKILMAAGTPCLFTSYTHDEAQADAQAFTKFGGHITRAPSKNPYFALEPILDPNGIDCFFFRCCSYFCAKKQAV